jgi:integrase
MTGPPSNPVAPTSSTAESVKLNPDFQSPGLSLNEKVGQLLASAGRALLEAGCLLQGKSLPGFSPVVSSLAPRLSLLTTIDLVNEFLRAKARAQNSDRYLRQLRVCLTSFSNGRAGKSISEIDATEVERWMNNHDWAARTCRGYVADVRTMFNYAVRRGYLERNPASGVELPKLDNVTRGIEVHTADQVSQVLETARRADLDVCRLLAVRYFAGLRSAEAHRIRESDLKLDQNLLEVPALKSKTRSRRLVTIQPNLRAWLDLGGELRAVGDMTIRKVIRLSKVEWKHNVTRHSFVSYHLAQFKKTNETALEAGHSEQMLFAHYRALVTPDAAAQFWAVVPAVNAKSGAKDRSAKTDAGGLAGPSAESDAGDQR